MTSGAIALGVSWWKDGGGLPWTPMAIQDDRYRDANRPAHRVPERGEPGKTPGSAEGEREAGGGEVDPIGRTAGQAEGDRATTEENQRRR